MHNKLVNLFITLVLLTCSMDSLAHADTTISDCRSILFSGFIASKYPIVMNIEYDDTDKGDIYGYYYYLKSMRGRIPADATPEIQLSGKTGKDGKVYENPGDDNKDKNYFVFEQVASNRITGRWVNGKTGKVLAFEVKSGPGVYSLLSDIKVDGERVRSYRENPTPCTHVIFGRIGNGPLLPVAIGGDDRNGNLFEGPVEIRRLNLPGSIWLMKIESNDEGSGKYTVTPVAIYEVEKHPQLLYWTEDTFGEGGANESSTLSTKVDAKDNKLVIERDSVDRKIDQDRGGSTDTTETWKYLIAMKGDEFSIVEAFHGKGEGDQPSLDEMDVGKLPMKLINADIFEFPAGYLQKNGGKYFVKVRE